MKVAVVGAHRAHRRQAEAARHQHQVDRRGSGRWRSTSAPSAASSARGPPATTRPRPRGRSWASRRRGSPAARSRPRARPPFRPERAEQRRPGQRQHGRRRRGRSRASRPGRAAAPRRRPGRSPSPSAREAITWTPESRPIAEPSTALVAAQPSAMIAELLGRVAAHDDGVGQPHGHDAEARDHHRPGEARQPDEVGPNGMRRRSRAGSRRRGLAAHAVTLWSGPANLDESHRATATALIQTAPMRV